MLLKFKKKFDKSKFLMQYDTKLTEFSKFMILTSVFELSHKSTENIFVVDEHNYFNSQPKVQSEEQIKIFIVP